ncbi:MAG TPA: sulfite exporter TauE/SafE family protein [Candidatus Atribacteria bacterium]|nr:sulfite exporter TauE/SafE family protein [Candidatus Atribacteria bacterium]HPT79320.1 sulfite exporter TauE/SafE family protein [Candidatus Atribacteria bacterium]
MLGLDSTELLLLVCAALLIGFSKSGITGASLPAVAMIAYSFDGKTASGIMLTMLIAADIPAIIKYGRYIRFAEMVRLLPPAIIGIVIGALAGRSLNDAHFKLLMGIIVLGCLVLIIYGQVFKKPLKAPDSKVFHYATGIISGFSSMVGNAAGPVFNVYLLSMSLDKYRFLGTTAWFFFTINLIKVPFHVFMWKTITLSSLQYALVMLPVILAGAFIGIYLVKKIDDKYFKAIVAIMTAIAAVNLML